MTKFMEWLLVGFVIISSWIAVITSKGDSSEWYYKWFPVLLLLAFGVYSILIILYRVFTFNNCEKAAAELQNQIKEATADLQSKGIILKKSN